MPTTDLWAALEEALERHPSQRREFLQEQLAPEDLERALELLEQADSADGFFDDLARDVEPARGVAVRHHEIESAPVPERIGPYAIVERQGVGGMGEVYRAERADGAFEQTVAIKLIRRSLDDEVSIERFRAERQILAQLEHPNIARLIDGGVTDDGRTYLVMEWVDGKPIDRWAAEKRPSTRDRVELFIEVCRAVEHAHRNLIVHRDIKPSNVLVDRSGRVKLLDFGIAKILSSSVVEERAGAPVPAVVDPSAPRTLVNAPLTPRYAAPEQVTGGPVSTATDIWALGVVLYEVLTGQSPFDHDEPTRPGADAATIAPPSKAVQRRGTPEGVQARELRGDLDAIVLACLRSETARRTATARELRDDLQRHLDVRPVAARQRTIALRINRWLRRNRAAAVVGAVALVLLFWGGLRLFDQYQATVRERDKAQAVSEMLVDLFRSSDPLQSRAGPPTAEEVLERGRTRLQQLDDQPALQASLANVLGEVHRNVGLQAEAIDLHEKALAVHRAEGPRATQHTLALQADALRLSGQQDRALEVAEESLALAIESYGESSPTTARVQALVGRIHLSRRELEPALRLLTSALATQSADPGAADLDLATTLNDLSVAHLMRAEPDQAEPLMRRAIELRSNLFGSDHPSIAFIENNLAALLISRARFSEAERLYRRLSDQFQARFGREHLYSINTRRNLGLAVLQQGRAAESLSHLESALTAAVDAFPEDRALRAVLTNYLGYAHLESGDLRAADQLLQESLNLGAEAFGDAGDPRQAATVNNVALLAERRGELEGAADGFRGALSTSEARLPANHPQNLAIRSNLARVNHQLGDMEAAELGFVQTLEQQRKALPDNHPDLAYTLLGLAELRMDQGIVDSAEEFGREALQLFRLSYPADHRLIRQTEDLLAALDA